MKVIGIRGNYKNDSQEMPSVYLMADSSLLKDGKPLFLPDFAESFIAYPSLVVRINRLGKNIAKRFASRYYDAVTVGLCLEAVNFGDKSRLQGVASVANAFDGAAVTGEFVSVEEVPIGECREFGVAVNGGEAVVTDIADMKMNIDELIEELSKYFTLKIGDILFTGYKEDSGFRLSINDVVSGKLDGKELLHFKVK